MGGGCVKVVVSHLHFMHILIARRAENLPSKEGKAQTMKMEKKKEEKQKEDEEKEEQKKAEKGQGVEKAAKENQPGAAALLWVVSASLALPPPSLRGQCTCQQPLLLFGLFAVVSSTGGGAVQG